MKHVSSYNQHLNESNDQKEKDEWWKEHHQKLIDTVSEWDISYWESIFKKDPEMAQSTMDSTGKQKALTLFNMFSVKKLNQLLKDEGY